MPAPSWLLTVYYISALFGVVLVVFVMLKTERDRINRIDPPWIVSSRRAAFSLVDLTLINTVIMRASQTSLIILVMFALVLMGINALALHYRTPPDYRTKRHSVYAIVRRWLPRGNVG